MCVCVSGGYMSNYADIIIRVITIQDYVYIVCLLTNRNHFSVMYQVAFHGEVPVPKPYTFIPMAELLSNYANSNLRGVLMNLHAA